MGAFNRIDVEASIKFDPHTQFYICFTTEKFFFVRIQYVNGTRKEVARLYPGKTHENPFSEMEKKRSQILPQDIPLDIKEFYTDLEERCKYINKINQCGKKWEALRCKAFILVTLDWVFVLWFFFAKGMPHYQFQIDVMSGLLVVLHIFVAAKAYATKKEIFAKMVAEFKTLELQYIEKYPNFKCSIRDQEVQLLCLEVQSQFNIMPSPDNLQSENMPSAFVTYEKSYNPTIGKNIPESVVVQDNIIPEAVVVQENIIPEAVVVQDIYVVRFL